MGLRQISIDTVKRRVDSCDMKHEVLRGSRLREILS
jgi:hypothetical protein